MKKRSAIVASVLVLSVAFGTVAYAAPACLARSSCSYRYVDNNDNGICDFREMWDRYNDAWKEEQNPVSQGNAGQQAVTPSGDESQGAGQGSGQGTDQGTGYGAGQGSGQGTDQGSGQGTDQGSGQGAGQGAGYGAGQGSGQGAGQGTGYGNGQGAGQGSGQGTGYGNGQGAGHHGGGHGGCR